MHTQLYMPATLESISAIFSGLSPRCTIWAMTDDFSGNALLGPVIPENFRNVFGGEVILEKYVSLATGVTIIARNTEGGGGA